MATSPHLHQATGNGNVKVEVEEIDEKSTYANEGDERETQRNLFEGDLGLVLALPCAGAPTSQTENPTKKHKFESSVRKENTFPNERVNKKIRAPRLYDEGIFKSGLAVKPENPYFVWRPTSSDSMRRNLYIPQQLIERCKLKNLNSIRLVDERGNEWETRFIKWCDGRMACSSIGWKKLCSVNLIRVKDRCICEFIQRSSGLAMHVRVIRAPAHGPGGNDGDESMMEMNIPKAKHKLKPLSSHTPVKRTVRKDKTSDRRKVIEEEKLKQTGKEASYLDPLDESRCETEDAEPKPIVNKHAYIRKLKGIIKTLVSENVNQKRVMFSSHKDDSNSSGSGIKLIHRPNSSQGTSIGSLVMSAKCLPERLEVLQSYFQILPPEKADLTITLNKDVLGKKFKTLIFLEDVDKFCLLESVSDCCIISYMWYLHRKMKKENLLHKFQFVNPRYSIHRKTRALADRLIAASTDQLVLAPCNVGFHWILMAIEPYNMTVFLLDPLSPHIRDEVLHDIVNKALSMFSASKGDNEKRSPKWVVIEAPLHPDSKQCGFYVMRYMKEIIETCRGLGSISLQSMFTKDGYSTSEIDEMRIEWAGCILDHIG